MGVIRELILITFIFMVGVTVVPSTSATAQDSAGVSVVSGFLDDIPVDDQADIDKNANEKSTAKDKKKVKVEEDVNINLHFFISMGINLLAILILILLVYYPGNRNTGQIFTFVLFNVVIFILTYVLNEVKISMGAAFGLFAVFSMLRYRTRSISMKDMTYLFIFIALGLINAVHLKYGVQAFMNFFVIVVTFVLDSNLFFSPEGAKTIQYDNTELIRPENHSLLLQDLRSRTGLEVTRFRIERVDFLRDSVRITVFYKEIPGGIYTPKNGKKD